MSTTTTQTPVKETTKARPKDSYKAKKRKHADDHEEPGTTKKKKQKKARIENDTSSPAPEPAVKKSKKRARTPPVSTGQLTPTSPSQTENPNSTPIVIDDHAPETLTADKTTPQHSPSPSFLDDTTPSPFYSVRISLYLPLSAISLSPSTALASLQAEHLSPLLLTYYAPARGIVLAFTDIILSSSRPNPSSPPEPTSASTSILAHCADDYGTSYTWLTTTLLIFRPTPGETLSGWINVCSDTFIGLIAYNYLQAGVAKARIPTDWRWVGPGGSTEAHKRSKRKKIRIRSSDSDDEGDSIDKAMGVDVDMDMDADNKIQTLVGDDSVEDDYDGTGYFVTANGSRVIDTLQFRVVDAEVVPGHDREKWSLKIEGTLLSPEGEATLMEAERVEAEKLRARGKGVGAKGASMAVKRPIWNTPGRDAAIMSGGLGVEDRRTVSVSQTPVPSSARR